jgi:hypothetical protein
MLLNVNIMNKYLKPLLLCMFAVFSLVSCQPTTEQLEEEVKKLAREKFLGTGVYVDDVTLVHKGGNDYKGIITLSSDGETEDLEINVVCDGRNFQYEIPALLY